ncbi:MAG TPA: glycosyltransferase family 4 protein [bacterium]|nr:glycosyltransferase family 4 protein [bacterium]
MPTVLLTTEGTRFAGIEAHLINLLDGCRDENQCRFHLAVFDNGPLAERARERGILVHHINRRRKYDTAAIRELASIQREARIEVVHTHGYLANVVAAKACAETGVPLVTTVHGAPEAFTGLAGLKMRLNLRLDRRAMRKQAARVITVASFLKDLLVAHHVPGEKIEVVANGIPDRAPDARERFDNRTRLELPPDAPTVAFIGRLEPVKDPLAFVELAKHIVAQRPQARFVVAGDGPLMGEMRERVLAEHLLPAFRFLGFVENVEPLLAACDLVAVTSRSEGVPFVILEALRAGRPVVAPPVGGLPEMLGGLPGMLAEDRSVEALAAKVLAMLDDAPQRHALGEMARQRFLARFTARQMAERTLALYRTAIEERP